MRMERVYSKDAKRVDSCDEKIFISFGWADYVGWADL
jgi:hypothetical protein